MIYDSEQVERIIAAVRVADESLRISLQAILHRSEPVGELEAPNPVVEQVAQRDQYGADAFRRGYALAFEDVEDWLESAHGGKYRHLVGSLVKSRARRLREQGDAE